MQANDTNEPNQEAALDSEIESLPQKDREETKQILDEIGKANAPKSTEKVETTQKPEKVEDKPTTDDGKKAADVTPKEEPKRREKVVPAWMLKIANQRQEDKDKTIAELNRKLEEAQKGKDTSKATKSSETDVILNTDGKSLEEEAQEYAEQEGISLRLAKDLITAKRLAEISHTKTGDIDFYKDSIRKQQEEDANAREEQLFERDFEKDIVPLIKKEYGDDVPASTIKQIKDDIKAKAYTEEFAKVPYTMIYKGDDGFRSLVPTPKKPVEGARTVAISEKKVDSQDTGKDLSQPLSDEEVKNLSDAEFDTYSKNMERRQGSIR